MKRDFPFFEEVHEELPRHAQIIGSRLGREGFIFRHHDDGLALGHQPNDTGEMAEQGVRNMRAVSLTIDQSYVIGLREKSGQFRELVIRDQRGI
jgi:hypothetical protein